MDITDPAVVPVLLDAGIDPAKLHLSETAAVAIVPTSSGNLRRSRVQGDLLGCEAPPFFKIGKSVRYRADVLIAWMEQASAKQFATNAAAKQKPSQLAASSS